MAQNKDQAAEAAVAAHYGMLLGIRSPWEVKEVSLQLSDKKVEIEVEHDRERPVACPQCQRVCPCHDHAPERQWRHLDVRHDRFHVSKLQR